MPCPGEFISQDRNSLVRLNGSVCRLLEDGIEPADAAACVKGGADIYVNPGQYEYAISDGRADYGMTQYWLPNAVARRFRGVPEVFERDGKRGRFRNYMVPSGRFSLYESADGDFVLHVTGGVIWREELATMSLDETRIPEDAIILTRS